MNKADVSRRALGAATGPPNSRAVSSYNSMGSRAFSNADLRDFPCALQPGSSGTSAMNASSLLLQKMMISNWCIITLPGADTAQIQPA